MKFYHPKGHIVELGNLEEIFKTLQEVAIEPETIRKIGEKYDVNAMFMGDLSISDVKPKIKVYREGIIPPPRTMRVKTEVELTLSVRLYETLNGFLVWSDSARDTVFIDQAQKLTKVEPNSQKLPEDGIKFKKIEPEKTYGEVIYSLIKKIFTDVL